MPRYITNHTEDSFESIDLCNRCWEDQFWDIYLHNDQGDVDVEHPPYDETTEYDCSSCGARLTQLDI